MKSILSELKIWKEEREGFLCTLSTAEGMAVVVTCPGSVVTVIVVIVVAVSVVSVITAISVVVTDDKLEPVVVAPPLSPWPTSGSFWPLSVSSFFPFVFTGDFDSIPRGHKVVRWFWRT